VQLADSTPRSRSTTRPIRVRRSSTATTVATPGLKIEPRIIDRARTSLQNALCVRVGVTARPVACGRMACQRDAVDSGWGDQAGDEEHISKVCVAPVCVMLLLPLLRWRRLIWHSIHRSSRIRCEVASARIRVSNWCNRV